MPSCAPTSDRSSRGSSPPCRATRRWRRRRSRPTCTRRSPAGSASAGRSPRSPCSGAMYGQTTGHGAAALRGLDAAYPVAMTISRTMPHARPKPATTSGPAAAGGSGCPAAKIRTLDERDQRSRAAARGRFGRNAMVQGAAAEFFKTWAVIVRARLPVGARIVLCLHDELLVHAPMPDAGEVAAIVDDALQETAARWHSPTPRRRSLRRRHQRDRPLVRRQVTRRAPPRDEPNNRIRRSRSSQPVRRTFAAPRWPLPWDR